MNDSPVVLLVGASPRRLERVALDRAARLLCRHGCPPAEALCNDCRRGYMISCTSEKYRRAYGWQRDGGMADFLLAEEKDLIHLPGELTYADGAQVAQEPHGLVRGLEAQERVDERVRVRRSPVARHVCRPPILSRVRAARGPVVCHASLVA